MRIIAGALGGRQFDAPNGHRTHPMSDKVRGALFNALGDITNLTLLDIFTGSGAICLEAVSRGAERAIGIDNDKHAYIIASQNVVKLNVKDQVKITRANCSGWSDKNPDQKFDLVVADPPFDDLQTNFARKLSQHVNGSGLFILNWPGKREVPEIDEFRILEQKNYGDTQLIFYKRV